MAADVPRAPSPATDAAPCSRSHRSPPLCPAWHRSRYPHRFARSVRQRSGFQDRAPCVSARCRPRPRIDSETKFYDMPIWHGNRHKFLSISHQHQTGDRRRAERPAGNLAAPPPVPGLAAGKSPLLSRIDWASDRPREDREPAERQCHSATITVRPSTRRCGVPVSQAGQPIRVRTQSGTPVVTGPSVSTISAADRQLAAGPTPDALGFGPGHRTWRRTACIPSRAPRQLKPRHRWAAGRS
jgi:hypothetical protein